MNRFIESAASSKDNSLILRYLDAFPNSHLPTFDQPFNKAPFWTSLTRETKDLGRSLSLLNRTQKQHGREEALAQIIHAHEDFTFREKSHWLKENLPSDPHYHRSMVELLDLLNVSVDFDAPNPEAVEWIEHQPSNSNTDQLLLTLIERFNYRFNFPTYFELAQKITDPRQRYSLTRKIATSWLEQNPSRAEQKLPSSLLEELKN